MNTTMKLTIKPLALLMTLVGGSLASSLALASTESTVDMDAMVKQINSQTQALEKQVLQLKREVQRLKSQQAKKPAAPAINTQTPTNTAVATDPAFKAISPLTRLGATPVIAAPYVGVPSEFDASDLVVSQSTYKLDQTMLQRDAVFRAKAKKDNIDLPNTPVLILSGKIESQIYGSKTYSGPNTSDINLTGAELYAAVHVNKWVSGLISFNYNDGPSSQNEQRTTNSNINVDQAFATIGDFSASPFYTTVGQRTLPFGHYSTYMLSDTLAKDMFKILARSILFGYDSQSTSGVNPYATTFVFKGDTNAGGSGNNINNFGANLGLKLDKNDWKSDFGVSGIANVADSNGMQSTGLTAFPGFNAGNLTQVTSPVASVNGTTVNSEDLVRKVAGINAYGGIGNNKVYFNGEYAGATSSFDANNMTYNGHGAKPSAMHAEGAYMFSIANFPANVALGYDHTWQAIALNMPQQRYISALNVSFIRNTIMSFELNRCINYAAGDTATGQNSAIISPEGHYQNNATIQFGIYF